MEYYIAPNLGQPAMPLARIASGGELSRVMLALKRLEAQRRGIASMIFDEVDAGIGGAVATVVGRKEVDAGPVIEIPASALTRVNQQPAVWIVDPKSRTVSIRNVDVLRFDQAQVVVGQGLDTGEIVVTAGVQALHPGQKIRLLGSEQ